MGKVWLLISLAFLFFQTMASYGCLSNLISKRGDAPRAIVLGLGTVFGLLNVYKWCSEAHKVGECVSMICFLLTACCEYIKCQIKHVLKLHWIKKYAWIHSYNYN
jgi:hypothetical protein